MVMKSLIDAFDASPLQGLNNKQSARLFRTLIRLTNEDLQKPTPKLPACFKTQLVHLTKRSRCIVNLSI